MDIEQAFLADIDAWPDDRAVRLVYADWLEEQGDPRAELIRIEEEMRRIPIYSDRYWELKQPRNERRGGCDEQWLERMRYGTDYEPTFRDVPPGWRQRWRLLREFTERWHGIPMADVGRHAQEVRRVEQALNLALPPSVGEWVAFHYDLEAEGKFEQVVRDCYEVKRLEDLSAVSLLAQGEADYYWAVREEDLHAEDPAVTGYGLGYEGGARPAFAYDAPFVPRLTSFVLEHLSACHGGGGGGFLVEVMQRADMLRQLSEAFPVRSEFDDLRIFERRNVFVLLSKGYLHCDFWKPLRGEEVPAFLRQFT
jgi:uncharacterized protein (TIGR02996 family)